MNEITLLISAVLGSGGLVAIINYFANKRKTTAEGTLIEVEALTKAIERLELSNSGDRERHEKQRLLYEERILRLEKKIDELTITNNDLRKLNIQLDTLNKRLEGENESLSQKINELTIINTELKEQVVQLSKRTGE